MNRLAILLVIAAACGGQSREARDESAAAGPPVEDVPATTLREHDWTAAARGHGAAPILPSDLARLDRESAPGASLDAGPPPPRRAE